MMPVIKDREYYLANIERIATLVVGFPVREKNIRYWNSLSDFRLEQVYNKWKELEELTRSENV